MPNLVVSHLVGPGRRKVDPYSVSPVGYMKLLFPHWTRREQVDLGEFEQYCLRPAVRRRGIIKEQCHRIDPEFKPAMPNFRTKA